jgi:hypothetical protein
VDDEPPLDEDAASSSKSAWDHEPPAGGERPDDDQADEAESADADGDPPTAEHPAEGGQLWADDGLSEADDAHGAPEPVAGDADAAQDAEEEPEEGGEERAPGDEERAPSGEERAPGDEERAPSDEDGAETDELAIGDEPPWGGGPPPWERNPGWELGSPTDVEAIPEDEPTLEGTPEEIAAALEDPRERRARERIARKRAGQRRLMALIAAIVILVVVIVAVTSIGGGTPAAKFLGSLAARGVTGPSGLAVNLAGSHPPLNILIADRNNNRLLSISPAGQVVWQKTEDSPSDAYLSSTGHTVVVTEHYRSTVVVREVDSFTPVYHYGHAGRFGSKDDYLHNPQTAQFMPNGDIVVADRGNCRILLLQEGHYKPAEQLGQSGQCTHHVSSTDPASDTFGEPDAAFPTADGGLVVTEANPAWVDVLSPSYKLLSASQLTSFSEPYDANQDPYDTNEVIVADRTDPGKIVEFDYNQTGQTITPKWEFDPTSGSEKLNKPTLARVLPDGDVLIADSGNDRVIIVKPTGTSGGTIVWQYGHTGTPGKTLGYLHTPDSVTLVPDEPPG